MERVKSLARLTLVVLWRIPNEEDRRIWSKATTVGALKEQVQVANIGGLNPMATLRAQAADHPASDRGGRKVRRAMGLNEPTLERLAASTSGRLGPELVGILRDPYGPQFESTRFEPVLKCDTGKGRPSIRRTLA